MSFNKTFQNRKDWRRGYYGSARFDHTCRPGGSCPWCRENRQHQARKALEAARVDDPRVVEIELSER
jgi:hypothetical protein